MVYIYHNIIIIILNPISPTSPTSPPTSSPADGSISLPTSEPGQHHRAAHHQVCQTGGRVPPPASDDSDCGLEVSLDADPPAEIGIFVRREPQRLGHSQRWVPYSYYFTSHSPNFHFLSLLIPLISFLLTPYYYTPNRCNSRLRAFLFTPTYYKPLISIQIAYTLYIQFVHFNFPLYPKLESKFTQSTSIFINTLHY